MKYVGTDSLVDSVLRYRRCCVAGVPSSNPGSRAFPDPPPPLSHFTSCLRYAILS